MNQRRRLLGAPGFRSLMAVVLLDSFSYSLVLPILPFLVLAAGGSSIWGGALVGVHALCCAVSAPLLGRLSDRYGSRPVLVSTLIVATFAYLLLASATTLALLFVARALSGAMAGNLAVVQAGVARSTDEDDRAAGMGFFTSAWALGFTLGPAVALLALSPGATVMHLPALVAAAGSAIAAIVLGCFDRPPRESKEPPSQSCREKWDVHFRVVLMITTAIAACQAGIVAMVGFFAHDLYGWSQTEVSAVMLGCAALIIAVQITVVPAASRRYGNEGLLAIALSFAIASCVALIFGSGLVPLGIIAVMLLCTAIPVAQTALSTCLSKIVAPDRQGEAMGASNGVAAIGRVIGPVVMGLGYRMIGPSAPFALAALTLLAAATVAIGFGKDPTGAVGRQ